MKTTIIKIVNVIDNDSEEESFNLELNCKASYLIALGMFQAAGFSENVPQQMVEGNIEIYINDQILTLGISEDQTDVEFLLEGRVVEIVPLRSKSSNNLCN